MEMSLGSCGSQGAADAATANYPQIREIRVGQNSSHTPAEDITGSWRDANPRNADGFSGVAFYFARSLHQDLKIPIGIINSSWGGTAAEAWMSPAALRSTGFPNLIETLDRPADFTLSPHQDPGNTGIALGYADHAHDDASWETMDLPRYWESTGLDIDGAVWFRREIHLPPSWLNRDLQLSLGALDDFDHTYFNGTLVGSIGPDNPTAAITPRLYTIPAKLLKPGRNLLAVRIFDQWGAGGFGGKRDQLSLSSGTDSQPLAGLWKFKVELALPSRSPENSIPFTSLYNGMIYPLLNFAIRGATWYQDESNTSRTHPYATVLKTLITQWRSDWKLGDFPFLIVQLTSYTQRSTVPGESTWAEIREAQARAAELPNTYLAVTIDVGEAEDIHPKNKWDIGLRLALLARAHVYHRKLPHQGPLFKSFHTESSALRVHFTHTEGGLISQNGSLNGFAIAGDDRIFHWADASIDGDTILLTSPQVPALLQFHPPPRRPFPHRHMDLSQNLIPTSSFFCPTPKRLGAIVKGSGSKNAKWRGQKRESRGTLARRSVKIWMANDIKVAFLG